MLSQEPLQSKSVSLLMHSMSYQVTNVYVNNIWCNVENVKLHVNWFASGQLGFLTLLYSFELFVLCIIVFVQPH